jgi:drug/metabolite transporter (DMT)-like permease
MAVFSDNARGAILMSGATAAYTINDALMKSASDEAPLFQLMFLRGILMTLFLGFVVWRSGAISYSVTGRDRVLLWLRTAGEVIASLLFLLALFNMPIANATAIMQALPLVIALAGAVFLRQPLGWRRFCAIGFGFVGVLMIVRPDSQGIDVYALSALGAVLALALRDLVTFRMSHNIPASLLVFLATIALMGAAGVLSFTEDWKPVSALVAMQLLFASVSLIVAFILSVQVMRVGDIGAVAPFRYTSILWALIMGWAVFGDWPDIWMLSGSAIVAGAGVFTLLREARLARMEKRQKARMAA